METSPITKMEWNIANQIGGSLQEAEQKQKDADKAAAAERDGGS